MKLKEIKYLAGLIFILLSGCSLFTNVSESNNAGDMKDRNTIRMVFYNTENLFDTIDQPNVIDEEFLPESDKKWGFSRYYEKLQKTAKVLIAAGEWDAPDLIGLSEIENQGVLEDLLWLTPLKKVNYGIIHKESPDARGIDVALFYNPKTFKPVYYEFIKVNFPGNPKMKTRDILYARGLVGETDTLHIFVNHWPSRYGGKEASEWKRKFVASLLKARTDSILTANPFAKIVIVGDFNDEPADPSITGVLQAQSDSTIPAELYNLVGYQDAKGEGSYKYKFEWNMIDQVIVSKGMLNHQHIFTSFGDAHVFRAEWLLEEDKKYPGEKPFRTFYGPFFHGGYSDHLPIYLDIYIQK